MFGVEIDAGNGVAAKARVPGKGVLALQVDVVGDGPAIGGGAIDDALVDDRVVVGPKDVLVGRRGRRLLAERSRALWISAVKARSVLFGPADVDRAYIDRDGIVRT